LNSKAAIVTRMMFILALTMGVTIINISHMQVFAVLGTQQMPMKKQSPEIG
jgi:hypothetical protein